MLRLKTLRLFNLAITHFANAPLGGVPLQEAPVGAAKMLDSSSQGVMTASLRGSIGGMLARFRFGAIQWLVVCGAALVIAIALGTAYFAMQFRQRALEVAEREQNNTALLLSRHFDQQLGDLQDITNGGIAHMT